MRNSYLFIGLLFFVGTVANGQNSLRSFSNVPAQFPIKLADTLKYCLGANEIGVGGYDLVSYFDSGQPALGVEKYKATYDAVLYHFMNEENRSKFLESPEMYLPIFGGWCSMTLAMGRATIPVYDNFLIINGRLYLFERTISVNGKLVWQQDPPENARRAQINYVDFVSDGIIQNK